MPQAIFTIPANTPFVDVLAAQLLEEQDQGLLCLEDVTILLSNRRTVRGLQEAFLRQTQAKATLLPRMLAVGDIDTDEEGLELFDLPAQLRADADLPPAIGVQRRRLILAKLILAARGLFSASLEQALGMADELARLLDQCQTEAVDLDGLDTLAQDRELAAHWQKTLDFLSLIRDVWPQVLADEGRMDPAQRRHLAMMTQARAWAQLSPAQPFILAGSTGSIKATRALMRTVLDLPQGRLILPGLDTRLAPELWPAVKAAPSHPQYGFALLADTLGFDPTSVPELDAAQAWHCAPSERQALARQLMLPATAIAHPYYGWQATGPVPQTALHGLSYMACAHGAEEAVVIALALRHALETPGKTAALVTPDRHLARRVQAELKRFGILVEETAGTPLKNTPLGAFMRLIARMLAEDFAPVPTLAVLKHPMARLQLPPESLRQAVRAFELLVLRGPRPNQNGLSGLQAAFAALEPSASGVQAQASQLVTALETLVPLAQDWQRGEQSLAQRLGLHFAFAEALAQPQDMADDTHPLWQEAAGEALEALWFSLQEALQDDVSVTLGADAYPDVFDMLMGDDPIRVTYGAHPRLAIWGTMEARLQKMDVMILGGLNEGIWPTPTDTGPWVSRPMREDLGLPSPERKIGLSAHDFAQALGAKQVILTRSLKNGTAPSVPSRWLLRLESILPAGRKLDSLTPPVPYLDWARLLDAVPVFAPRPQPQPRPPLAARPRRLSVTQIGTWMRDPYGLYARKILMLEPLDPLDADPTAADKGNILHAALHRFIERTGLDLPPQAEAELLALATEEAEAQLQSPLVRHFWLERQGRIVPWFIERHAARLPHLQAIVTEKRASWSFQRPGGPFELTAFADRIDQNKNGHLVLIDYKTGNAPTNPELKAGLAPQMPLEALIAQHSGWHSLPPSPIAALEHWELKGGEPAGKIKLIDQEADLIAVLEATEQGLFALIDAFDQVEQAYLALPDPNKAPRYNPYEHLERPAEWQASTRK